MSDMPWSCSGNGRTDSLLLNANTDTLSQGGPLFFDYYIRRDFGLESIFSPTVQYFAGKKIYDTQAIKATIVWAYYNFLKGEPISFQSIRKKVIKHYRGPNSKAKRRLKKQLKKYKGEIRST